MKRSLRRSKLLRGLAASVGLAATLGIAVALADPPLPPVPQKPVLPAAKDAVSAKDAREQELEGIRAEQKQAHESEAKLAKDVEAIGEDRRKLNAELISTAARIRAIEDRMTTTELRLTTLADNEGKVHSSLLARRGVIVEILAALQRLGRNAAPAMLVSTENALGSVRTAMLLGAVLPRMRTEAQVLAHDLAELARVRSAIAAERDTMTHDLGALALDRQRMSLLIEERRNKLAETEKALESERQRATALGRQADSLKDLIAKLQQNVPGSARTDSAGRPPAGSVNRPTRAALGDAGRLAPAIAFAAAKGALQLPVNGVKLRDFGAPDGVGGTEKGLWLATRPAAQVTAPCDGWVVYAGPFRSYGQLLILNAGDGYHVLLAGMERISVDLGQFVLTGEPVAAMGGGPQSAAAVTVGSNQPVLYVEFRKDGAPVDPSPWWATTESEKVRG